MLCMIYHTCCKCVVGEIGVHHDAHAFDDTSSHSDSCRPCCNLVHDMNIAFLFLYFVLCILFIWLSVTFFFFPKKKQKSQEIPSLIQVTTGRAFGCLWTKSKTGRKSEQDVILLAEGCKRRLVSIAGHSCVFVK